VGFDDIFFRVWDDGDNRSGGGVQTIVVFSFYPMVFNIVFEVNCCCLAYFKRNRICRYNL
jgi:hypothetical protein